MKNVDLIAPQIVLITCHLRRTGVSSLTAWDFYRGRLSAPLAVFKVLKTLDLRCAQAATAIAGGPVERPGPDFR
jgi:hypothetical protein